MCPLGGKSPSVKLMSRRENKKLAKTNLRNMDKTMQKLRHIGSCSPLWLMLVSHICHANWKTVTISCNCFLFFLFLFLFFFFFFYQWTREHRGGESVLIDKGTMLGVVGRQCYLRLLRAKSLTGFKLFATTLNNTQQHATWYANGRNM